ncbi:MAG: response regulator [Candidatus Kuenenia sp.]|nr:response regulator [Candidatus Kuenenia hertensis]
MLQGSTIEKTLQILIVDDNKDFCMNCIDILESKGYSAVAVHDGLAAMETVRENSFDLALIDIKMPVMNGVDTYKMLKQIDPQLPVIIMSAYAVEDLIEEALKRGAFAIFHKPLDFEKLFSAIKFIQKNGAFIMIVDDDNDTCENLSDLLQEKGYRVKSANDGETAIQLSRENLFDIILLDMKLPGLNGLETFLAIRAIRPSTVVILITGYMSELKDLIDQAMQRSAHICLEKPLNIDRLLNILQEKTL